MPVESRTPQSALDDRSGVQDALRHVDARTTSRYDMARAKLDRHAAHSVAAYLAGMAMGWSPGRRPVFPPVADQLID